MDQYTVAVVGATGVVGQEVLKILEERDFPVKELILLSSERSAGTRLQYKDQNIVVKVLTETSFKGVDFAIFSAGGSISKTYAPLAVEQGAIVIDNTSHFRMDPKVPLIVPEVNGDTLTAKDRLIANPNCSTAQMVLILKPLYDKVGLERVVISTYQSVSGAGKEAVLELENQTRRNLQGQSSNADVFPYHISFNVIPQIDAFTDNGYTKEEMKMIQETQKILNDDRIRLTATTVRVPVFVGHSEAINIQTKKSISPNQARSLLKKSPGVQVLDDPKTAKYPTPRELAGEDDVYVGRIRTDISQDNGLELWCVGDNLRKGAALNAVQIAEHLIQKGLTS